MILTANSEPGFNTSILMSIPKAGSQELHYIFEPRPAYPPFNSLAYGIVFI